MPETKGIPLEEMARMFGDEVVVSLDAVHVDHGTHEVVIDGEKQGTGEKVHQEHVGA